MPWIMVPARKLWRLRQPKFSAGVVGVVVNDQHEVLLVEHVFHPYAPWGLPGGWIDRNEDPSETLMRELYEELELRVEMGPMLLSEIARDFGDHIDFAYVCRPLNEVGQLSSELLGYRWTPIASLPRVSRFHYRAIQHAFQIAIPD
jgi:ADP-ribose pyrophosphatase YjhB (NUDIX family)